MKIKFDHPYPGQYAIGLVSWPSDTHRREVYLCVWRWALCLIW